ncbi:hypothetical protein Patl1_36861 [Pistacia atlantica]|nr:hypothetical protein Patl1_36861 [Pistacia atlantica]
MIVFEETVVWLNAILQCYFEREEILKNDLGPGFIPVNQQFLSKLLMAFVPEEED